MNCQDISHALDDRDIGALSAAQRREFDAHLAACPDCAQDWELHQRMMAVATPEMPAALPAQVRLMVAARHVSGGRRGSNRFVLLGVVLAVAAAAAMLAVSLTRAPSPPVAEEASPAPAPAVELDAVVGDATLSPADQAHPQPSNAEVVQEVVAPVPPFTVQLLPLENKLADVVGRDAAVSMYEAFRKRLRAVPGLTLLEADSAGAPEVPPGHRIKVIGENWSGKFGVNVEAETLKPDGSVRGGYYTGMPGDLAATCTSSLPVEADFSECADPEGLAINLLGVLRKNVFPPDPSLKRNLQARLLSRSLDATQRLRALTELASFGRAYYGIPGMQAEQLQSLRDPAVVRGALELATATANPQQRASVWNTMRGVDNPSLVQPLLAALRQDPDHEVRVAALGTLGASFGKDPRVSAALETIAQQESDPMVRALAHRMVGGVAGDAAWRQYILASLKESGRPAIERIEALFYQMNLPVSSAFGARPMGNSPQGLSLLLDAESIPALVAALPPASGQSATMQMSVNQLVRELSLMEHPAITDMLLASIQGNDKWLDTQSAIYALGQLPSRRDDPRVRSALEKIRADDPNPLLRQTAGEALNRQPASYPGTDKPRLGLVFNTVKVGDAAPPELVGKLVILTMGSGVGQRAGMRVGDAVLAINGSPVTSPVEAIKVLDTLPRGVDIDILIERAGETLNLKARF